MILHCITDGAIINNPIIGIEEQEILIFQIESLQYQLTATSSDEKIISKLERCHKRCQLAFFKLQGDHQRLKQRIENLQNEIDQPIHQKSMLLLNACMTCLGLLPHT